MNSFYREKAALPRQCRNAESLKDSLDAWVENRLMHVYEACKDLDDEWRNKFGDIHLEYAEKIKSITSLPEDQIAKECEKLLIEMNARFKVASGVCMPGWLKGSIGLCGSELEKIMETKSG